jgi:hypothetical protein
MTCKHCGGGVRPPSEIVQKIRNDQASGTGEITAVMFSGAPAYTRIRRSGLDLRERMELRRLRRLLREIRALLQEVEGK